MSYLQRPSPVQRPLWAVSVSAGVPLRCRIIRRSVSRLPQPCQQVHPLLLQLRLRPVGQARRRGPILAQRLDLPDVAATLVLSRHSPRLIVVFSFWVDSLNR